MDSPTAKVQTVYYEEVIYFAKQESFLKLQATTGGKHDDKENASRQGQAQAKRGQEEQDAQVAVSAMRSEPK